MALPVVVFGATGKQGEAVAKALLKDKSKYEVFGATRNPESHESKQMQALGAKLIKADLNDKDSIRAAVKGAHAVFLVTKTSYSVKDVYGTELAQIKNLADACLEARVEKVVFSTMPKDIKVPGLPVEQLESKADGFEYMKAISLPIVGVMLTYYFENVLEGYFRVKKEDGVYGLAVPIGEGRWPLVSCADLGGIVKSILADFDKYRNEIIILATDFLTLDETAAIMSKHLSPVKIIDPKLDREQYGEYLKQLGLPPFYIQELSNMFEVTRTTGFNVTEMFEQESGPLCKKIYPDMMSFEKWVIANKELLKSCYN